MLEKRKSSFINAFAVILTFSMLLPTWLIPAYAATDEASGQHMVQAVIQSINDKDVGKYISLFNESDQMLMNDYLSQYGSSNFFEEETIDLVEIKRLSYTTGITAAQVSRDELENFQNIEVYYTKENVVGKPGSLVDSGIVYKGYVIGTINNTKQVIRISTLDTNVIIEAGESFSGQTPIEARRAMLCQPSTITIYFTHSENIAYYGDQRKTIDFDTYLKNGIPSENSLSYYTYYPESLKAAALAYKMFGWYFAVNPRRSFAPYYANLLDNRNDQNFYATAYADLLTQGAGGPDYQNNMDLLLNDIDGIALTKAQGGAENNLFPTQYRDNIGSKGSGILNQAEALNLEKNNGFDYQQIIHYYYDYSSATDGSVVYFRSHV